MTASNLDQTLRTRAAANVIHAGAATVPARKFLDYIKLLPAGDIRIKLLDNSWVQIQAGRSRRKMVGMVQENFPQVPTPDKLNPVSLPVSVLRSLIAHTSVAVSAEESRYTLYAALLILEERKISMVATDGHRLAIAEQMQDLGSIPATRKLLIPAKALHDLAFLSASTRRRLSISSKMRRRSSSVSATVSIPLGRSAANSQIISLSSRATIKRLSSCPQQIWKDQFDGWHSLRTIPRAAPSPPASAGCRNS